MTELCSHIHWLAVLAGAAAFWFLGAIWYSPVLFSKRWVKLHGFNMDDPNAKKGMAALFIGSFVLMFISSTGIGVLNNLLYIGDIMHAVKLGLLVSVCFSAATIAISYVYTKKPAGLYLIDCGYYIVGSVLASVVIKLLS